MNDLEALNAMMKGKCVTSDSQSDCFFKFDETEYVDYPVLKFEKKSLKKINSYNDWGIAFPLEEGDWEIYEAEGIHEIEVREVSQWPDGKDTLGTLSYEIYEQLGNQKGYFEKKIADLEARFLEYSPRSKSLNSKIDSLESRCERLETMVETLDNKDSEISDIHRMMTRLGNRTEVLLDELNIMEDRIEHMQTKLEGNNEKK